MKGKTKLYFVLVVMSITLGITLYCWYKHNFIGLAINAFFLVIYYPIHIWDAVWKMKIEKSRAESEAAIKQYLEEVKGLRYGPQNPKAGGTNP